MRFIRHFYITLFLALAVQSASAFALLGPFAPWMNGVPGYQNGLSIGGPMNIGEGYRWNVPVVTYGFDQSFLDYFGSNGVAAVESAIQILNDLPPASAIDLTNYAFTTTRYNYTAEGESLMDLKSHALAFLLEQMGLTSPSRYVFCLSSNYNPGDAYHGVNLRSFDPTTLSPSDTVDDALLGYAGDQFATEMYTDVPANWVSPVYGLEIYPVDPSVWGYSAVADDFPDLFYPFYNPVEGKYYTGLTQEDAGGLRYLLNATNIALESLIPGVRGSGANATNFVNRALRPGIEKITFQQLSYNTNAGQFAPITNQFVDSYLTNGQVQSQTLERVITQPDILFTVRDLAFITASRTGTTNWVNNGLPSHDGPGVIQPPIEITFNLTGPTLYFGSSVYPPPYPQQIFNPIWSSFDESTNPPIVYPASPPTRNFTTFHFQLSSGPYSQLSHQNYAWNLYGGLNSIFALQTSTNLTDWISLATITNQGGIFNYYDYAYTNTPRRFFRTVPQ